MVTETVGSYSADVSTWEAPRMRTQFVDNRYGRDSFQTWDDGKDMEVTITVKVLAADDMLTPLNRLLSAIEQAGFVRT